jgi:hypothetical protein
MFTGIDIFINMINEEINKMKYMFTYKPGVVISEQETPPPATGTTPTTGATPSTGTTPPPANEKMSDTDINKLRDCANFKSSSLKQTSENDDYVVFTGTGNQKCKKPKEKK